MMNNKEIRAFNFEVKANNNEDHGNFIEGRAIVYDEPTDMGMWDEIIDNGALADTVEPILNHPSLFDRDLRTVSFTWKGDPRMQPLDYLTITDDTVTPNTSATYRVTNIELKHEAGGTTASIEARRWS